MIGQRFPASISFLNSLQLPLGEFEKGRNEVFEYIAVSVFRFKFSLDAPDLRRY
jgi:hypothetical protein